MANKTNDIKKELVYYSHLMDELGFMNSLEGNLSILDRETGDLYAVEAATLLLMRK